MIKKTFLILMTLGMFSSCEFSKQDQIVAKKVEQNEKYKIDRDTYSSKDKDSRIKYIILHYTAINDEQSKRALTERGVSSHYLITSKAEEAILGLVPERERAWHAGISYFKGRTNINDSSIGIEIVNLGLDKKKLNSSKIKYRFIPKEYYLPYTDEQIEKTAFLLKKLVDKYGIEPKHILGHSDIAPGRKPDPGPMFPWKELYENYGLGAWYDKKDVEEFYDLDFAEKYSVKEIKDEFLKYGYDMTENDEWDNKSIQIVQAFQAHFNSDNITGVVDAKTFAIIRALNKKYK